MMRNVRSWLVPLGVLVALAWPVVSWGAPPAQSQSSCVVCHENLSDPAGQAAIEWQMSVHAAADVGCEDCHGGDPAAEEAAAAMSPAAGFRGVPPRTEIPALCGGCHADPARMAPFELPTDQLKLYSEESVHGQRLAQGDVNVATCYDCHGRHAIREVNDPSSSTYPVNLPATCGSCHADPDRMAPYGIATDQLARFENSVHGVALLQEHNLKAPTCATCHGNHGAALPGRNEVVDLCGSQCHPAVHYAYVTGSHAGPDRGGRVTPRCVTCHGRYDVQPATLDSYLEAGPRGCGSCHPAGSPGEALVKHLYEYLSEAERCLEAAHGTLDRVRMLGINVDRLEVQLATAETNLVLARVAQHSMDLALVSGHTYRVTSTCAEIESTVEDILAAQENWRQVRTLGVAAAVGGLGLIGLAIGLITISSRGKP